MTANEKLYQAFLGNWQLDPEWNQYEQGNPPKSGSYNISECESGLLFQMDWVDSSDKQHNMEFSGKPDGVPVPFPGGELADHLSITAVSSRELNSSAYKDGRELMIAQRQLDETGQAMRVTQIVRLPDGSQPANVSLYRKVEPN